MFLKVVFNLQRPYKRSRHLLSSKETDRWWLQMEDKYFSLTQNTMKGIICPGIKGKKKKTVVCVCVCVRMHARVKASKLACYLVHLYDPPVKQSTVENPSG